MWVCVHTYVCVCVCVCVCICMQREMCVYDAYVNDAYTPAKVSPNGVTRIFVSCFRSFPATATPCCARPTPATRRSASSRSSTSPTTRSSRRANHLLLYIIHYCFYSYSYSCFT